MNTSDYLIVGNTLDDPKYPIDAVWKTDYKNSDIAILYVYMSNPLNRFLDLVGEFSIIWASLHTEVEFIRDINSFKITTSKDADYRAFGIEEFWEQFPEAVGDKEDMARSNAIFIYHLLFNQNAELFRMFYGREIFKC
jgi:hypothetical protein